jgi:hypothetical protein
MKELPPSPQRSPGTPFPFHFERCEIEVTIGGLLGVLCDLGGEFIA